MLISSNLNAKSINPSQRILRWEEKRVYKCDEILFKYFCVWILETCCWKTGLKHPMPPNSGYFFLWNKGIEHKQISLLKSITGLFLGWCNVRCPSTETPRLPRPRGIFFLSGNKKQNLVIHNCSRVRFCRPTLSDTPCHHQKQNLDTKATEIQKCFCMCHQLYTQEILFFVQSPQQDDLTIIFGHSSCFEKGKPNQRCNSELQWRHLCKNCAKWVSRFASGFKFPRLSAHTLGIFLLKTGTSWL